MRILTAALAIAAATAASTASAQNFQTALPLSADERRALEVQIGAFLDFARTGGVQQVNLPTGRQVTMRAYAPVLQQGRQPCRGYRLDLAGADGVTAVDGFRCRRADGAAWAIVEPETVISQSGPLDLRGTGAVAEPSPTSLPTVVEQRPTRIVTERAPVPRPAPRRPQPDLFAAPEETAALAPLAPLAAEPKAPGVSLPLGTDFASEQVDTLTEDVAASSNVISEPLAPFDEAPGATVTTFGEAARAADSAIESAPQQLAAVADQTIERSEDTASVTATSVRRVVGDERQTAPVAAADGTADESIIAALADLDYLPADGTASAASVRAAISDFALDERFALPVPPAELRAKLNAALDRSEGLPSCDVGGTPLCVAPADAQ